MSSPYLILLPQAGIGILSWVQIILSMNRYQGIAHLKPIELLALTLFNISAAVRWVGSLALRTRSFEYQITAAVMGSILTWTAFVLIFNARLALPSRQQWGALIMTLVLTVLWEINGRLVFDIDDLSL